MAPARRDEGWLRRTDPGSQPQRDFARTEDQAVKTAQGTDVVCQGRISGQTLDALHDPGGDDNIIHQNLGPQVEIRPLIVAVAQTEPRIKVPDDAATSFRIHVRAFPLTDVLPWVSSRPAQGRRVLEIGRASGRCDLVEHETAVVAEVEGNGF